MVTIVAVLVVTVASQSRNSTRQQQTDDIAATEFRHPRFIGRIDGNSTEPTVSPESIILERFKAFVMRVVTPASNSSETVPIASGRLGEIVDNEAGSGTSTIISSKKRK